MADPTLPDRPTGQTPAAPTESGSAAEGGSSATGGHSPPLSPLGAADAGHLFGRYALLTELGRGGMGIVWKAWDTELKRVVALKQVLGGAHPSSNEVDRFLREARLAAGLRHPHIVSVYDVGQWEGQYYYTAEYIDGRSFCDMTRDRPAPRQVATWVREIAEALAFAHAQGVVHRDVKPGNILVARDGTTHLTDFGLAKQIRASEEDSRKPLTVPGAIMGTPHYMSPEQASGEGTDVAPASDQFSLGIILYEALAGARPFDGATAFEVAYRILRTDPRPLRAIRPDVPRDLETICFRAMEKSPAQRYPDLAEMAADLGRWLKGEPIRARPVSPPARLLRIMRRHPAGTSAIVLLLLLIAIGVEALVTRARHRSDLAAALREGDAARAHGDPQRAGEAYRHARDIDPADAAAADGVAWAEAQARRQEAEARRNVELLNKRGLVAAVTSRWIGLLPTLAEMHRVGLDTSLTLEEKRAKLEPQWRNVQAFMDSTPDDPASRSAMLALAGWARYLSGARKEGIEWMDEARRLDPDVSLGASARACVCVVEFLLSESGILQERLDAARLVRLLEARKRLEAEVEPLLAEARAAALGGEGFPKSIHGCLDVFDTLAHGKVREADERLAGLTMDTNFQIMQAYLVGIRGRLHGQLGDWKGAVEQYTAAIGMNPWIPGIYAERARARLALGDKPGALADFDQDLRLSNDDVEALLDRARLHEEMGDAAAEMADLDAAVKCRPGSADARERRGVLRLGRGDDKGAIEDLEVAARADTENAMVRVYLAQARQGAGDLDGAIAECDRALLIDRRCAEAYHQRGFTRKTKGDVERALQDYDEAIRLRPDWPEAHNNRGRARYAKRDYDGAIADYGEAVRARPDYAEALANRGRAEEAKGDLDRAVEDYAHALHAAAKDWSHRSEVEKWLQDARARLPHR